MPKKPPFTALLEAVQTQAPLRAAITRAYRLPEPEWVPVLVELARLPDELACPAHTLALRLSTLVRTGQAEYGLASHVQGLLQEFSLSTHEGVALMCLAEALLRIPDNATRDALIHDKLRGGNWRAHLGQSRSLFVNAATWGLLISGTLAALPTDESLAGSLSRVLARGSDPLIRRAVDVAMRLMGEQFVAGRSIEEALARAEPLEHGGFRHSYDMLGEAALTAEDARRYFAAYETAIHAIGKAAAGRGVHAGPGISIKLSALHPRYTRAQRERVMNELYPALRTLVGLARRYGIGLNIDAEEADRLDLSLDLLERLCFEPELSGWDGIGFVVQAYQKRALAVIDYLLDLAERSGHRLMVRLVKGAYWDSEIKRAQVDGVDDYPVFTRKCYTDVSYLACARRLLGARLQVFPQFATHNAQTLAAIYQLAGPAFSEGDYEFQCLHGMGEALYRHVVGPEQLARPCRIYAPVGSHETLLAYLVRRLLENGANTSFVNRIADASVSLPELVEDPVAQIERMGLNEGAIGLPHPRVPVPGALYQPRRNSRGLDLASEQTLAELAASLNACSTQCWHAGPMLAGAPVAETVPQAVLNPADHRDQVGTCQWASAEDVANAYVWALQAAPAWRGQSPAQRAECLERAADLLEDRQGLALSLLVREAGKTYANAVGELREAVDFLRYYAQLARGQFDNSTHVPLGTVVCISPWNFPLAIFTGQIAAALAAGNVVLAKPAEQTPLIAAFTVRLLHEAGIPAGALQLLPGLGEQVGAQLVSDSRVRGVMFTGSTQVARLLQRSLAGRLDERGQPLVLVAETGGLNAMIVDSSALPEQVVQDALVSAFDSAGQRCSALRLLCLQDDIAERVIGMLEGAMAEWRVGDPQRLQTDLGPLIDTEARQALERHIQSMAAAGHRVHQAARYPADECAHGTFLMPTLIELERVDQLQQEVFGPVLHVLRYRAEQLAALIEQINARGYGLTGGLHSRIDATRELVRGRLRVGNLYVNRNMIGAVVGAQPFGGERLSGTGPKAGGPLYLHRLLSQKPRDALQRALPVQAAPSSPPALLALRDWATSVHGWLSEACMELSGRLPSRQAYTLPGPTGEQNTYQLLAREGVLCLADSEADLLVQLAAVVGVGSSALWQRTALSQTLYDRLPALVRQRIELVTDWHPADGFSLAMIHGTRAQRIALSLALAEREGPLVRVVAYEPGERWIDLQPLLVEHVLSLNSAAAGGNASLMTLG